MAFRLADALQRSLRATLKFQGAPDPVDLASIPRQQRPGFAEKQAAFQSRQASQTRLSARRRMRGRLGIQGPFGFTSGGKAPLDASSAAELVSGQLGTPFADEFNRFTAPDPEAFARGARAPEFIGQELDLGRAGVSAAELENQAATEQLPFIAPGLQQGLDVGEQRLLEARAAEDQAAALRPSELETAQQVPQLGQLEIEALERQGAGAPLPETVLAERAEDRAAELSQRERGIETAEQQRLLDRIDSQIETARIEGDLDKVDRLERQAQDIVTGFTGPRAPEPGTLGGAPPISSRSTSPIALGRRGAEAEAIGEATGLDGAIAMLTDAAGDTGLPSAASVQKMETALLTIEQSLAMAPNEQTRNIMKATIRNSEGYIGIKQRAGLGDMAFRGLASLHPLIGGFQALTGGRQDKLRAAQQTAQQIVQLVEGSASTGGAPPIQPAGATGGF